MFVCNVKVNVKKIMIWFGVIAVIIAICLELGLFGKNEKDVDIYENNIDYIITEKNFTNMLKDIHENIDSNVGKTIKISGFVFTMPDFKDNYFVCGRNMLLSGNEKVVGFLCDYENAYDLLESEWVEVTGVIEKGFYQTDMPIIQVKELTKITAPENTFVNPPSN